MKRVLLCERDLAGHRKQYLSWLTGISDVEIFVCAPENVGMDAAHFVLLKADETGKDLRAYCSWIRKLRRIVRDHNIDVVHILDGDSIMRYFGLGFANLGAKRIIITYHHFFEGLVRRISYRMMNWSNETVSVVHTENVKEELAKAGVKRVEVCQYPAFDFESLAQRDPVVCRRYFDLPQETPVIGIVGGMSRYKNIVPFLESMKVCKINFHILICGASNDVTEEEIKTASATYAENVTTMIRHLSEEEYKDAIVASDIIYCIYGHEFNGASGPLTDGVCAEKMILACRHGSLGQIVAENGLGFVAECTSCEDMRKQAQTALEAVSSFQYGDKAHKYRANLDPVFFQSTYGKIYL